MPATASNKVYVVGVGMTNFEKPGKMDWDYPDMAKIAVTQALADAAIPYDTVEQACVGYCYGDSTCGQRAIYQIGLTGIPVYNVNNNCATGSTALFMAKQFVQGGLSDCVLALGFEKMERGSLGSKFTDRTNPMDKHVELMMNTHGFDPQSPVTAQMFGNAGREHMEKYGTRPEHFAKIAEKNHRHSANNPRSQFKDVYTLEQIMGARGVYSPLTKLQCCPTSDGAAAALVVSERFVYKYGLQDKAVEILGMQLVTDRRSTFEEKSMMKCVGYDMTKQAAQSVYREAGLGPQDVQVVELHDCFSANELITYEALGLCEEGKAGEFIDAGDNTYGGKYVVNPSGGLISKGHPLGATGLAQCAELCWQVRGMADARQVPNANVALQHNLGLGGAAVVAMYKKADLAPSTEFKSASTRPSSIGSAPQIAPAAPAAAPAATETKSSGGGLKSAAVFHELGQRITPAMVKKVQVIYRFDITGAGGSKSWVVDLKNGNGGITEGEGKADCTIQMKDDDFVGLMSGKLNPQMAFMQGKLKIKGNMMLAQKLSLLKGQASKL